MRKLQEVIEQDRELLSIPTFLSHTFENLLIAFVSEARAQRRQILFASRWQESEARVHRDRRRYESLSIGFHVIRIDHLMLLVFQPTVCRRKGVHLSHKKLFG
jgi:hypothetical protein